jgi:flagella basal body P-ring formation protein FlgA
MLGALARDLASHFRLEGDLQLEWVRPWTPPARTASAWEVVVAEYPSITSSTMVLRCRLLADGAVTDDSTVILRAALWRDAWVSRQPLSANSTFDPSLLTTQRVDALRDRDALPATAGDRSNMWARQVPANRLLTWHDLARRPWVRKGEVIDVVAADGGLQVTLKAQALENGGQGDVVEVRNLESHKDISALVVSENRVEVRF